ncbi:hypothetical protein BKP45_10575 [Anaerobacillus alkalidiazotrophicus]|uniref:Copper oxidase n=1 Tax=Anaerobacillus alkalidiazotrophicus TaxID=472963 RepID=A0A1S2M474_9BACI|nr:multicopper oxidase family protein [Anaerobacillus alkalidiazotrophicus]OIJ18038.1 hypothetical protein BKP45_16290 [Anaerobacillus alkalidiazotrophicus]OIJ19518.1 hypothetical protein BKP45_10575 [Anaerobacillus alkalidiazotrophicus]
MKKLKIVLIILFLGVLFSACSNQSSNEEESIGETTDIEETVTPIETASDDIKIFTIEAVEENWQYTTDKVTKAWMYNGMLPGEEIRVNEGDEVELRFLNSLPVSTALHLHGLPIVNEMDGVPGVTQNVIQPGEEFIYSFKATLPGTYWYHSHENSAEQLFRGMYGAIVVEESTNKNHKIDQVVFISEWSAMVEEMYDESEKDGGEHGSTGGAHGAHGNGNGVELPHNEMMNDVYNTVVINGKAGADISGFVVKEGESNRLRFINSGLYTQTIVIPNHEFKVTHYDGQPVNEPTVIKNEKLLIAPGERYDIEIILNNAGAWGIEIFAEANKEKLNSILPLVYEGYENERLQINNEKLSTFDMTKYGQSQQIERINSVTKEFEMVLASNDGDETFTINGKKAPDLEVYEVNEGDVIKMTITNISGVDHPMHSHGHFFYVISKNGVSVQGSPILKDTLNVRPGETYEIVLIADNAGKWFFHCHELHHAESGMISLIDYAGN